MFSFLIFVGAVQGIFLAIYWFAKAENRKVNKWLALLLTVVSLHLAEYASDISGFSLGYPFIIASTYPLLFLMGPLFFIYCRALLDPQFNFKIRSALHFIPAIICTLLMLPFYTMPNDVKVEFITSIDHDGSLQIPVEQFMFMGTHVLQTILYVYASSRFIRDEERSLKNVSSDTHVLRKLV